MRVVVDAHTVSVDHPTGVSLYILNLVAEMARLREEDTFTVLANAFRGRYAGRLAAAFGGVGKNVHLEVSDIPNLLNRRAFDWIWHDLYLPRRVARAGADLLFAPDFVLPSRASCPCVVTVHDLCPVLFPEFSNRRIWHSPARQIGDSIRRADFVLADSESVRSDVLRAFQVPKEKVVAVPLAADPSFRPIPPDEAQRRVADRFGIPVPFALYAGTSSPRKNVARMVAAFRAARNRGGIQHELVLAGPGASPGRGADGVRALGYVPMEDLVCLYNTADFFLFPSVYEGFGIPIVEAMLCGAPVLTSDRGAMKEVASDAALLADPYDVRALADAICELASNAKLRTTLRDRGFRRAKDFSWERTARETLAVFQRAVR